MVKNKNIRILNVVGARPNMMKIAPLLDEMRKRREIEPLLLHTGQHYDRRMSKVFFEDLAIPEPDIYLGSGSGSHAEQTAGIMVKLERVLMKLEPDLVVVVGDVNSTLAAAITASKLAIPVAHVEAGLRSFDRTMPEEINRIVTDSISDYLFAPSPDAVTNLINEGHSRRQIFFVGNIMIDTLMRQRSRAERSAILEKLGLAKGEYAALTLHRPANVDDRASLDSILTAVERIEKDIKIVFPMHLRTRKMAERFGMLKRMHRMRNVVMTHPLGYLDFLNILCKSKFVLTDSGGIQEETTALGIPCITLRDNTERPSTITVGTNILAGNDTVKIVRAAGKILKSGGKQGKVPKFWDGRTSGRIVDIITRKVGLAHG
ncbi:MAG: UDP-N-acetylglucosamine 2-epimerase (non-hydrolyzing) [Candidatus Omnitrophota bacterium]